MLMWFVCHIPKAREEGQTKVPFPFEISLFLKQKLIAFTVVAGRVKNSGDYIGGSPPGSLIPGFSGQGTGWVYNIFTSPIHGRWKVKGSQLQWSCRLFPRPHMDYSLPGSSSQQDTKTEVPGGCYPLLMAFSRSHICTYISNILCLISWFRPASSGSSHSLFQETWGFCSFSWTHCCFQTNSRWSID